MFILNEAITEDTDYEVIEDQSELEVEDLLKMVQQLPFNQRMVFNLFAIEGYNHTEISKMTGLPENTSKSHLHRARIALKEMITSNAEALSKRIKNNV